MRESSGVASGLSANPSGGGGITALGDRFQPDLVKGTGNYSVPIDLPKGPNEIVPSVSLTYSTGAGNGPFGMGWRMDALKIERRTDRGIPEYLDKDSFVFGDGVVLINTGNGKYRPATDNVFWLIEFKDNTWNISTGDGRRLLLGQADSSREICSKGTFAWYLDKIIDQAGNEIRYKYTRHGERLYLSSVEYSIFTLQVIYEDREDVLRNARAGFMRTTAKRAASLQVHCSRLSPTIMRSYDLQYEQALNGVSLLSGILLSATQNGETAAFPKLDFHYSELDWSKYKVDDIKAAIAPPPLGNSSTQVVDLNGDGLPDILQTSSSRTYLWSNNGKGELNGPFALHDIPSLLDLSRQNVAFADLDGNGRVDLFSVNQPLQMMFANSGKGGFDSEPVVFKEKANIKLADPRNRLMDIDGDGVIDLLETGKDYFLLYKHEKYKGWNEPIAVKRANDMQSFPDLNLGKKGIYLESMKGDGLQDLVWLKSGQVCYWPYLGNGAWGEVIEMPKSPVFPKGYREERIILTDVDGDGCTDIVYFDYDRMLIWINKSGNIFSDPIEIPFSPAGDSPIIPTDFFGEGRSAFVWSSTQLQYNSSGYRCLRIGDETKPYLLSRIENGMGGIYEMDYSTSAKLRADDLAEGREWLYQLPFPVHVVTCIRHSDTINNRVVEQNIRYHDGVFDGWQRDFRGFTHVEFTMSGDDSLPGTRQELTFFHGDPDHPDLVEREKQRLLAGSLITTKIYEILPLSERLREESVQEWDTLLLETTAGGDIFFPFLRQIKTFEYSITDQPVRIEVSRYEDFDQFGNVGKRIRQDYAQGQSETDWIITEERFFYLPFSDKRLFKLMSRSETYDGNSLLLGAQIRYYDGDEFVGLPEGNADKGMMTRTVELKMIPSGMPAGYADGRDFTELGFVPIPVNGEHAWFATTMSVARDANGNITKQKDAIGNIVTISYDADHLYPVSVRDIRNNTTQFEFDPRSGEPSITRFADGRITRNVYDPIGRLTASFETNEQGNEVLVKCWITDIQTLPVSVTSIVPRTEGRTLAEFRNTTNFETLNGVSICKNIFSGLGTQIAEITTGPQKKNGDKQFVLAKRSILNPKGAVSVQFPQIFIDNMDFIPPGVITAGCTRYFYDYKGSTIETAGPSNAHFKVVKDNFTISFYEGGAAGETGLEKPAIGSPSKMEEFDAKGRLTRVNEMDPDGNIINSVQYVLTADGQLEKIKDHAGDELVTYTLAGPRNVVQISHRDIGKRIYYRDASGKLVEKINPDNSVLYFIYDNVGRVTLVEGKAAGVGAKTVLRSLIYDADPDEDNTGRFLNGRLAVVKDGTNILRYSYNKNGKTKQETIITEGARLSNQWEFNMQGEVTAIVYPDGERIAYIREDCGTVKEITGVADEFVYGADGSLVSYVMNNGVNVHFDPDPDTKRIRSISAMLNTDMLRSLEYEYDLIGNITAIKDQAKDATTEWHEYKYDPLHRITNDITRFQDAAGTVLHTSSYGYDAAGNLTQFNDLQSQNMVYADAARKGRLTDITHGGNSKHLQYDNNANIMSVGDLQKISFDGFDRMISVQMPNKLIAFSYDQNGRRILKKVTQGGTVKTTRYAAGLFEQNENNTIKNIYLDKYIICSKTVNTASSQTSKVYYLNDHHGTILSAFDQAGNILANQKYSAFGSIINNTAALDKYLGRDKDSETALLQLGARYYASFLGRFISPDWYVLENPSEAISLPQAFNIYSYSANNPLVFKDPSGMFFFIFIGVIMAVLYVAAIATAVAFAVGFIAGLVYGLSTGMGWESLLRGLEAGLTTMAGMWLGAITGMLVGSLFGPGGMIAGAIAGGIVGGLNGAVSGMTGIYNWSSWKGWAAFLSDSTWGLLGTALGLVVHAINIGWGKYRSDLSERQNRHVYESGIKLKSAFAFTMGNVISNAGQGGSTVNTSFIANHEELHVWQSRIFGPLFQVTYIVWAVGGFLVALGYWVGTGFDKNLGSLIETAAYYDNPFEYWAYENDNNWPPSGANPDLRYG